MALYGDYKATKTIGHGSYSIVKLAVHQTTGVSYAMKIYDKETFSLNPQFVVLGEEIGGVENNATLKVTTPLDAPRRCMRLLSHEHLVNAVDILETNQHYIVVEELMEGGELFDEIVSRKHLDEDTARFYFRQLLEAVRTCHDRGVLLHELGDQCLKPENLLLSSADKRVLKLSANFAVKKQENGTMLHCVMGTPYFSAPEVLRESPAGTSADMWSCGVILYVMLEGQLPFDDPSIMACFQKIERGLCSPMKHVPEPHCAEDGDVRDLVAKLLVTDPTKRLTMVEVLRHPWVTKGYDESPHLEGEARKKEVEPIVIVTKPVVPVTKTIQKVVKIALPLDSDPQSAFTLIPTMMEQVATSMSEDPPKLIGNEKPYFTFHGSVEAALHCTLVVGSQRMWNIKRKEGTNQIRGFSNTEHGLMTFVIGITATLSDTTTIMSVRRRRGPTNEFQKFKAELVAAIREENKPVSWSWELHHQCRDATRLAVCWMHCGMVYACSKTHSKQPLPAEVAGEICSWLRVPYVVKQMSAE